MLFCYIFNVDTKLDRKDKLEVINEVHVGSVKVKCCSWWVWLSAQVCEMKNCTKCIYFEMKKKKDVYMWISNVPEGPSMKFLMENGIANISVVL